MVLFGWIFREKAHGLFISCHRCSFKIMSDVMHMFLHKVCVEREIRKRAGLKYCITKSVSVKNQEREIRKGQVSK